MGAGNQGQMSPRCLSKGEGGAEVWRCFGSFHTLPKGFPMKNLQFQRYVYRLVEKVAGPGLESVVDEANILVYHDEGMTEGEQVTCANLAAAEVLFENGYLAEDEAFEIEMA